MFYVAVTRAKYRCYIVWADVRSEQTANDSAMAWLLDFADADFCRQQAILQAFKDQAEHAFDYRLLDVPGPKLELGNEKAFIKKQLHKLSFRQKNAKDRYTPTGK